MKRGAGSRVSLAVALLAGFPPGASGQQVNLLVKERGSLSPIAGALVRLLGEQGVVMQILTSEAGRATLRASAEGTYRIRIDQIGAAGVVTLPFGLASGETRETELVIQSNRVSLPPIEVRGHSRCGSRTEQGTLAAILWDEIAKALSASVIGEQAETLPLLAQRFRRELGRDARPLREWVEYAALHQGRFYSTFPPAFLIENGFVLVDKRDSVVYAAPDADLLLSDEFVATHCFQASIADGGLVGLTFEPIAGRKVADVRGTLWVRRETSELKFLEYSYTGLPRGLEGLGLGGRVEYRRLPTGSWIVNYWYVRTPVLEARPFGMETKVPPRVAGRGNFRLAVPARVAGFLELGGRITPRTERAGPYDRAVILGQMADSTTGGGVSGAVIHLEVTGDSAVSDTTGKFALVVSTHGVHELIARHPKLNLPGVRSAESVLLSLGDTTRVEFVVASARTLAQPSCGRRQDRAGVIGIVLGRDGTGLPGLQVRAEWHTAAGALKETREWSGKQGLYALCDLPPDELISITLLDNGRQLLKQAVELEWGAYRWLDLRRPE